MDQYKSSFTEEAHELIAEMESSLLQLEQNPDDNNLIQQVFRAMHTLKGNSSMFGFKVIAEFTHHFESIYEFIRSGQQKATKEILDISLASLDHLSALVDDDSISSVDDQKKHAQLTAKVVAIVNAIQHTSAFNPTELIPEELNSEDGLKTYLIHFRPHRHFFYNGSNPLYFIDELQALGECIIEIITDDIPAFADIDPTLCYTSWKIRLETKSDQAQIKQVFLFAEHISDLEIREEMQFDEHIKIPEPSTSTEQAIKAAPKEVVAKKSVISSVRVPSERLDTMMSLVSELITLQAKLGTLAEHLPHSELLSVTENLEKISTRLRDNAFSMCLLPINHMLTPFNRLVRDLADGLNKEIEFLTEGTETELDKNIMEGLSDPLMHLLRNSIDHGIEDPELREQVGKPRCGTILFKAYCSGTNVFIEIKDDGKGMDPETIREKAIQKGIIGKDEILNEKEIFNLIFLPGFSTAEKISEISGRGVGMDVVKRKITDIRGQIKVSSQLNIGTTITIKLPLTVSIIDGLLVKVNDADFVIPLSSVDRCFELPGANVLNRFSSMVVLDGEQVPFISLAEEFYGTEKNGFAQEIILVYHEERRVALLADYVVGKFQAVLKPLGRYFQAMETISGATILGDGRIALVLDTSKVIEHYSVKKRFALCH
ncbi:chemotaxis protein CheA [Desertivirga arenae]|uniref:chemotaxis protein CheA n=1 Tax=Desertivirga arenae TaxID=2810309 RepID=UPI001A97C62A|nr:chemotaxis protein CheA [Pedobacter sp. SYSU D00823]